MSDDLQTITTVRRAADAAVRGHQLESGRAAAAWSAAHSPHHRRRHVLAIAAGVVGAVLVATALAVWRSGDHHAVAPATGSACAGNVTTDLLPTWARVGFSPAGLTTPHVFGTQGEILAVLFVQLRVHQPEDTGNKILWVAKAGYGPLHISAHREGSSQTVTRVLPDGPGPSYVDMPAAGCWQMSLTWSGYHDTLALRYEP